MYLYSHFINLFNFISHMRQLLPFCFLLCVLFSCNSSSKPDISNINIETKINRFDTMLFTIDTLDNNSQFDTIKKQNLRYWNMYTKGVLSIYDIDTQLGKNKLRDFITNKYVRQLYDTCALVFKDVSKLENRVEDSFKYLKYYFPKVNIPDLYFHISGFNQSIVVDKGILSISIDKYLGEKCRFYNMMSQPIPIYKRKNMKRENIPFDIMKSILLVNFPSRALKNNLISAMLYKGSILYAMSKIFPNNSEAEIMGYSKDQYDWCIHNELPSWSFFIDKDYLFSSDYFTITKYVNDAPYTSGMPSQSPGRVANWIALQIVKAYAKNNDKSPLEILQERDYEKILRLSSYQPK